MNTSEQRLVEDIEFFAGFLAQLGYCKRCIRRALWLTGPSHTPKQKKSLRRFTMVMTFEDGKTKSYTSYNSEKKTPVSSFMRFIKWYYRKPQSSSFSFTSDKGTFLMIRRDNLTNFMIFDTTDDKIFQAVLKKDD